MNRIRIRLSPRARAACAVLCALWVVIAAVRLVAWQQGHPADAVTMGFGLAAGAFGLTGLVLFVLGNRRREG